MAVVGVGALQSMFPEGPDQPSNSVLVNRSPLMMRDLEHMVEVICWGAGRLQD